MTKNSISIPRAIMLAMALAAAGQDPGVAPVSTQARAEQAPAQEPGSTQAPPSATLNAGRRLEELGIITSGRQWRNFRKYARHNPIVADFWARTLRGEV